jgi:hypothetical protein
MSWFEGVFGVFCWRFVGFYGNLELFTALPFFTCQVKEGEIYGKIWSGIFKKNLNFFLILQNIL